MFEEKLGPNTSGERHKRQLNLFKDKMLLFDNLRNPLYANHFLWLSPPTNNTLNRKSNSPDLMNFLGSIGPARMPTSCALASAVSADVL